jgi:hypothetical protein
MKYPNIKKGARWGLVVGGIFALLWLGLCCWLSMRPPIPDSCFRFGPVSAWIRSTAFVFRFFGLRTFVLASVRPEFHDHDNAA